jgi:OPA family glycerol-3-phosphate transporter-like MFS transporter
MTAATEHLSRDQVSWRWRILISTYFAYAGFYLTRKVFTICKAPLAREFNVDLGQIAHIWTAYLVAYMVGQFLSSVIGRKWGPRVLLLGGLAVSVVINVIFGIANSYWTFLVFMFFNGLAQAAGWPGCVGGISEWLRKKERGSIMGVWSTNYLVGNMLVKSIGGFLLASYGWRYAFFGCTIMTSAIWWVIYFWQRNKPQDVGLAPLVEPEPEDTRTVRASTDEHITMRQYMDLALNPVVIIMGISYFSVKFLRYALDSWLPTFLNMQGMDVGRASYYSGIFDFAGLAGAIIAGWALDRWFRGQWQILCFIMGIGMVLGYVLVVMFGANPYALAICFGAVGFMIYGPDTILSGAASVQVAGERNGVAVAGLVNGVGSLGPVVQEEVIGWIMGNKDANVAIRNANLLTLSMSIAFLMTMIIVIWYVHVAHKKNLRADTAANKTGKRPGS